MSTFSFANGSVVVVDPRVNNQDSQFLRVPVDAEVGGYALVFNMAADSTFPTMVKFSDASYREVRDQHPYISAVNADAHRFLFLLCHQPDMIERYWRPNEVITPRLVVDVAELMVTCMNKSCNLYPSEEGKAVDMYVMNVARDAKRMLSAVEQGDDYPLHWYCHVDEKQGKDFFHWINSGRGKLTVDHKTHYKCDCG